MQVKNSHWFTKIDCFTGFYKIKLAAESRQFTAFSCELGLFQFVIMPMGLTNAPATFQRALNGILQELIQSNIVIVFFDDFLIHSGDDRNKHYQNVLGVINLLKKFNIKIKLSKCVPLTKEVKFLGYVISFDSLKPDPDKIAAINNYERPMNMQQLQSFLGLTGFYRKFVASYAKIVKPLYELLVIKSQDSIVKNKNGKILTRKMMLDWNLEAENGFYLLKKIMCSYTHVLILPDFKKDFIIETEACDYAYGGVISQMVNDVVKPIAYYSGQFTKTQCKYSTGEKELLSVVKIFEKFHSLLYGSFSIVNVDHLPLKWLLKKKGPIASRLARWLLRLSMYEFDIKYKPGKANGNADGLSRMPDYPPDDDEDEEFILSITIAPQNVKDCFDQMNDPDLF